MLSATATVPRRHIQVIGWDFDGCIGHIALLEAFDKALAEHYLGKLMPRNRIEAIQGLPPEKTKQLIFEHNAGLMAHAKALREGSELWVVVFSNRQDLFLDTVNGERNGLSSFEHIPEMAKTMGAYFYAALLADVCNNLEPGTTHRDAMPKLGVRDASAPRAWFDKNKVLLTLAHCHLIAMQNPDADITFSAYDDLHDILSHLTGFLAEFPELLPHNMSFESYQYAGAKIVKQPFPEKHPEKMVRGSGKIAESQVAIRGLLDKLKSLYEDNEKQHFSRIWSDFSELDIASLTHSVLAPELYPVGSPKHEIASSLVALRTEWATGELVARKPGPMRFSGIGLRGPGSRGEAALARVGSDQAVGALSLAPPLTDADDDEPIVDAAQVDGSGGAAAMPDAQRNGRLQRAARISWGAPAVDDNLGLTLTWP
jgi:hypothetical protein